jgi:hypothetical protein
MMLDNLLKGMASRLQGTNATEGDVRLLRSRLPHGLIPDWLAKLLKGHGLAGVCFSLSGDHDCSGLGAELVWLTPAQIISEAFDAEPGRSVVSSKFLPIGSCATGSGDPYFLDLREASNDPPVVRIPHEHAGGNFYPLQRVEVVASCLSNFFRDARF